MSVQIIQGKSNQTTVVFLHGYLLSSEQWSKLALHRAPWRSVLVDLPFHGTHKNTVLKDQTLNAYAEFIKNELIQAGISQYNLVGHSMGGYIGLRMLEIDINLDKLILLHSNIWEDSLERKNNRDRVAHVVQRNKSIFLKEALPLLFKNPTKHKNRLDELIKSASMIPAEGIIHGALSMRDRTESHEIVHQNRERCFFIQGSHDSLIPKDDAKWVWEQVAESKHFILIPDCGHISPIEKPRSLSRILRSIVT